MSLDGPPASRRRFFFWELTPLLVIWAAAIAFIDPRGEFPIADDWDFTIATWNFARSGHFQFTPFTAVSLRAMVLWGALWTHLFGESFLVLRLATLTVAVATIVVIHRILVLAGVARAARLAGTAAFAFSPIVLWSSCTYMTEMPFVFASAVAVMMLWRGIDRDHLASTSLGCAAVLLSCFVRQTGVITALAAAGLLFLFRSEISTRWQRHAAALLATLAVFAVVLFAKREWLTGSPQEFASHYKGWGETSFRFPDQVELLRHYATFNVQNAALFFLPLVVPLVALLRGKRRSLLLLAAIALAVLPRVQHLASRGLLLPYFAYAPGEDILPGNVFMNFGLGAPSVSDVWFLGYPYPFHLGHAARVVLTYGSVIGAALLMWSLCIALAPALRNPRAHVLLLLTSSMALLATFFLIGSTIYVDRYTLDSAWPVVIALTLIIPWRRVPFSLSIIVLIIVTLFATLSVQEYFAWNRARWTAYRSLLQQGILPSSIDGGNEPFSFFEVAHMTRAQARRAIVQHKARPYLLAFRPLPGYAQLGEVPFTGWLGAHRGAIYVLRRR